jgi:DNA invertase Pin-like site-specific DNA recombinase
VPPILKEPDNREKRAAAYIRLTESGPDRDDQEKAIVEAAEAAGLQISDKFVEVAEIASGDIVDRRMGLFELLGAAHEGKIKTVVVSDCRAISNEPLEAALIELMLEKSGVGLIFADGFETAPYREAAQKLTGLRKD